MVHSQEEKCNKYESKKDTYFPLTVPDYRFDQRNEVFKRRAWDDKIIPYGDKLYKRIEYREKYGYRKLDYALRNAAWNIEYSYAFGTMCGDSGLYSWNHVADEVKRFVKMDGQVTHSPEENARIVKKAAKFLGADLVGICYAHPNLIYSHELDLTEMNHHPVELPEGCTHAVVMAITMDYDSTGYSPDSISGAATGRGYSQQAILANQVATFIRGLGYKAASCGNDTALSIPLAIAAGLGELGRNGLLITEKFGPRVRLCKIFTDLPLEHDDYRPFGATEFCEVCKKCAEKCPAQAISYDEPTTEGPTMSNHSGVKKWYINPEKCFMFWAKNWMDCNNCVMSCPFNKPSGVIHDIARFLIRWKNPIINWLLVKLDDILGYGKHVNAREKDFWESAE